MVPRTNLPGNAGLGALFGRYAENQSKLRRVGEDTRMINMGPGNFGDSSDLRLQALPQGAYSLTDSGIATAIGSLEGNDIAIKAVTGLLNENPKAAIAKAFNLTLNQKVALWQVSNIVLKKTIKPILDQINAGHFSGLTINFTDPEVDYAAAGDPGIKGDDKGTLVDTEVTDPNAPAAMIPITVHLWCGIDVQYNPQK